jgi:hypothetical protein
MLLIILTGTTETDLEDGQERLLKLLYLKVSLIMDQVLTIGNRNFGNYWFYLGPAGNIVMVYGRENINTAVLSIIRQLTYH